MPESSSSHSRSSLGDAASICFFLRCIRMIAAIAPTTATAPTVAAAMVPAGVPDDEAVSVVVAWSFESADAGVLATDLVEVVVTAAVCSLALSLGGNVMVFPLR